MQGLLRYLRARNRKQVTTVRCDNVAADALHIYLIEGGLLGATCDGE